MGAMVDEIEITDIPAGFWQAVRGMSEPDVNFLYTLAYLVVFVCLALIKLITFLILRYQRSKTEVGKRLKPQKWSEFWLFAAMAVTFGLQAWLLNSAPDFPITRWQRHTIQAAVLIAGIWASWRGVLVVIAMASENWGRPARSLTITTRPKDTTDDEPDRTDLS